MTKKLKRVLFVVDTEDYSGNFERDLLACLTGIDYEYYHKTGVALRDQALKEIPKEMLEYIHKHLVWDIYDPGDDGFHRCPAHIWPTPRWFNNGHGGHFREGDEVAALAHRNEQYEKHKKQIGHYPGHDITQPSDPLQKYPCYQSVAILFDEVPPTEIMNMMKKRAADFGPAHVGLLGDPAPVTIAGFRLLKEHEPDYEEIPQ